MPPDASAPSGPSALRADAGSDGGPNYEAGECPDFDPARWAMIDAYATETGCFAFAPASKETRPLPYVWEACGRDEFGPKCRRLKLPPREELVVSGDDDRALLVDGRSPPKLELHRVCTGSSSQLYTIGDVDGPTRAAIAHDPHSPCYLIVSGKREGFQIQAQSSRESDDPKAVDEWGNPVRIPIDIPLRLLPFDALATRTLDKATLTPFRQTSNDRLDPYWRKGDTADRTLGAPRFKRFAIATDGIDVVWMIDDPADRTRSFLRRAAFKEDPSDLETPTRFARLPSSEVDRIDVNATAVGSGYFGTTTNEGRGLVIRMKDGVSFHLPKLCAPLDDAAGCATRVMGFTSSDAFLAVGGRAPNVFRVPLDTLPNPETPEEPPQQVELPDAGATDAGAADAGADAATKRDGG